MEESDEGPERPALFATLAAKLVRHRQPELQTTSLRLPLGIRIKPSSGASAFACVLVINLSLKSWKVH